MQQYQRIEPDKYALYLACLFRKKETASLLLNHPDIDPNCLYLIMNERDSFDFDPAGLADSNLSESLIGWIVAADVDGSIGDSLLKIAERLESELILDLLCCKILVPLRKSDSESLINALKSFAALDRVFFRENYLLAALFGEMGSRQMDVKPVMSYIVNDDSYNWAAKLEKIDEDELDNLFSDSNAKLACDMIGVLLAAPQFYPFILVSQGLLFISRGLNNFQTCLQRQY
ncbi:hypothetical protein BN59_03446 [Legionella massiliensis]|uniref:Ankyrin repeats (3 copies) n=1 Tax=Legionella massiliensis TaxID=1034943 RepID=A0A078L4X7_9GAMM|nr:hypothetical protein [Legionella massiliensis]CDZ79129.1 hypothetical protein BN59_03446 [Legionella massiliensis]CEE14867.1 hypothetical protein BN1094_03446 [Legionella massiliensis]